MFGKHSQLYLKYPIVYKGVDIMDTLSIAVIAIVVIIFLGLVAFKLYSNIKLKGLRQTAIDLIVEAENAYEKGKNSEKFQAVFKGIIEALPAPARIFLNESTINYFIQSVFDSIKGALDNQPKE